MANENKKDFNTIINKKIIIILIIFLLLLIVFLIIGKAKGDKLNNKLIGTSWGDEEYDLWRNQVWSDEYIDSYKIHFISKNEIQIWYEHIVTNLPSEDRFKHAGEIIVVRKNYSISCFGNRATIKIVDSDPGFFKTLKINFDNKYNITKITTNDFSSSKYNIITFEQLSDDKITNLPKEGHYFIEAPNLMNPEYIKFDNSSYKVKTHSLKRDGESKIYFFKIGDYKSEANKIYHEYQEIIKKESGYKLKFDDDMIYLYKKNDLVSIISAGYDDENGYFMAVSFLDD